MQSSLLPPPPVAICVAALDLAFLQGGGSLPATEADRSALDREEKRKRMFPNDVSPVSISGTQCNRPQRQQFGCELVHSPRASLAAVYTVPASGRI